MAPLPFNNRLAIAYTGVVAGQGGRGSFWPRPAGGAQAMKGPHRQAMGEGPPQAKKNDI